MVRIKKQFLKLTYILEIVVSLLITIQILLGTVELFKNIYKEYIVNSHIPVTYYQTESFLGQALLLVVGLELIIMLVMHTPGSIIEALLYAIARKLLLIPKESNLMLQVLLGVIAIAGLFFIKKYLITKEEDIFESE